MAPLTDVGWPTCLLKRKIRAQNRGVPGSLFEAPGVSTVPERDKEANSLRPADEETRVSPSPGPQRLRDRKEKTNLRNPKESKGRNRPRHSINGRWSSSRRARARRGGGRRLSLLGRCEPLPVDRRRLRRIAALRNCAASDRLPHRGSGHRQPACRSRRRVRSHRSTRLPAALAQSEAQVAAAKASIENIDAQTTVQQAQVAQAQAQVTQAQATLGFANSKRRVTRRRHGPAPVLCRMPNNMRRNPLSNRRR